MFYQMANLMSQKANPPGWPLLTDDQGLITEGSGWNFFIVSKGRVLTPRGRNILLGITRRAVLELLPGMAVPWSEEDFGIYEVVNADEAFCTATSFAIMPCTRINGQPIGRGRPDVFTQRLIAAWNEMVGVDISAQANDYAKKVREMESVPA
jgi:branched-chain amino acid aminotransferase